MHTDPLATWEKDSIAAEIEVTKDISVIQTRLECPWCDKKHLVTMDRTRRASGRMMCGNCGQYFKWLTQDGEGYTRRSRGKLKWRTNNG